KYVEGRVRKHLQGSLVRDGLRDAVGRPKGPNVVSLGLEWRIVGSEVRGQDAHALPVDDNRIAICGRPRQWTVLGRRGLQPVVHERQELSALGQPCQRDIPCWGAIRVTGSTLVFVVRRLTQLRL